MDLGLAILFSILLIIFIALLFSAINENKAFLAFIYLLGILGCFGVIIPQTFSNVTPVTYYNAECGDKSYNVYENKDGFYLTETNKRIVLSECCTLIESEK